MEGAWAFFSPGKTVPKFKFKQNGGRTELARNCGGVQKKNLHNAWCSYVKLSREMEGKLIIMHADVGVFLNMNDGKVVRCAVGTWYTPTDIRAVGAADAAYMGYGDGSSDSLTMTKETFSQNQATEGYTHCF